MCRASAGRGAETPLAAFLLLVGGDVTPDGDVLHGAPRALRGGHRRRRRRRILPLLFVLACWYRLLRTQVVCAAAAHLVPVGIRAVFVAHHRWYDDSTRGPQALVQRVRDHAAGTGMRSLSSASHALPREYFTPAELRAG